MQLARYGKTILASGVALAAATTMLAPPKPASAALQLCFYPQSLPGVPGTDTVKLAAVDVDFGTQGLNSSYDPVCSATVYWNTSNGTIRPEVSGDLTQRNNIGVTARVLVSYYDIHDVKLGPNYTDGAHTATSNLQTFPVRIDAYTNPLIYRVEVKTQVQSAGSWTDMASQSVYLGSSAKSADDATIAAVGEDFGGAGGLINGAPVNPGTISWDLSNQIRAEVVGTLYFNHQLGATARLRLKTFDVRGVMLNDWGLPSRTPVGNGLESFPQNYGSVANDLIYRAELSLEVLIDPVNDVWQTIGNTVTAYI